MRHWTRATRPLAACLLACAATACDDGGGGDLDMAVLGDGGLPSDMDLSDGMPLPDGAVGDMATDMPADCPEEQFFLTIREDTRFRAECSPYRVQGALVVSDGALLTIEAGVEVHLGGETQVMVGQPGSPGGLIAEGTAAEPIRFVHLPEGPSDAPRWAGIRFDTDALPTTLRNVVLADCASGDEACVQVRRLAGQVTLDAVTIRDGSVGVRIDDSDAGTLSGLVFEGDVPIPLDIHANRIGALDEVFEYPEGAVNRIFFQSGRAAVTQSATWIDQGIPWRAPEALYVEGPMGWAEGDPIPLLTLEAGVALEFPPEGKLHVGDPRPGGLVTRGSAAQPVHVRPAPGGEGSGQIRGVMFGALSRGSDIDGLRVTSGGFQAGTDSAFGCLSVGRDADVATEVRVVRSTFEDCDQAGIGTDRASDGFAFGALSENTFRRSPYGVRMRPNHLRTFTGDQTYDEVLNNAIVGGVSNRAPGVLSTPATWASQAVSYNVIDPLEVEADLVIEGPNRFNFEPDTMLRVAEANPAHLIAMGAEDQPVEFAAANDTRGGWGGIVFHPNVTEATNLTFAVVRDGGGPAGNLVEGCITLRGEAGPISLVNVQLLRCEQAGLAATGPGQHFQALSGITISDTPVGLHLHPDSVGAVAVDLGYQGVERNLINPGSVSVDSTWIAQAVPWQVHLDGNAPVIDVDATLTLDAGFLLQFPASRPTGGALIVGDNGGAQLIAQGTEAEPVVLRPVPGDAGWNQLRLETGTLDGTALTWLRVEGAGAVQNRPAIFLHDNGPNVRIQSPRFSDIGTTAIECDAATPTLIDVEFGEPVVGCMP